MPISGFSKRIAQGENLDIEFQVYENSITDKKRIIFTGDTAPTAAGWAVFSLTAFTVSHTILFQDNVSALGTSSKVGDVAKLAFTIAETEAAEDGTYYGIITIGDGTDSFEAVNYSFEVMDEPQIDTIPVKHTNIIEELGFADVATNRINRAVIRACTRVMGWLNEVALRHFRDNGYPIEVSRETEHTATLLLRIELNDEDEQAKTQLAEAETTVRNMVFDTDFDEIADTAGGTIQLIRGGSLQNIDADTRNITKQFQGAFN